MGAHHIHVGDGSVCICKGPLLNPLILHRILPCTVERQRIDQQDHGILCQAVQDLRDPVPGILLHPVIDLLNRAFVKRLFEKLCAVSFHHIGHKAFPKLHGIIRLRPDGIGHLPGDLVRIFRRGHPSCKRRHFRVQICRRRIAARHKDLHHFLLRVAVRIRAGGRHSQRHLRGNRTDQHVLPLGLLLLADLLQQAEAAFGERRTACIPLREILQERAVLTHEIPLPFHRDLTGLHGTISTEEIPFAFLLQPTGTHTAGLVHVVPFSVIPDPAGAHGTAYAKVIPVAAVPDPARLHPALCVKMIPFSSHLQPGRCRPGSVGISVPPFSVLCMDPFSGCVRGSFGRNACIHKQTHE